MATTCVFFGGAFSFLLYFPPFFSLSHWSLKHLAWGMLTDAWLSHKLRMKPCCSLFLSVVAAATTLVSPEASVTSEASQKIWLESSFPLTF